MSERIDEKGEVASFLNRVGSRLRDGTLSTFGNNRAQGRLDTQNTAEELRRQFTRWAGQQGVQPTLANINTFLLDTFNYRLTVDQPDTTPEDEGDDDENGSEDNQQAEEPKAAEKDVGAEPAGGAQKPEGPKAAETTQKTEPPRHNGKADDNPLNGLDDGAAPKSKQEIDAALLRLKTTLYNRKPDATEAIRAIREIMSMAKASGADSKKAAMDFIQRLRQDTRITDRYPGISQITDDQLDTFNENFERVTACAQFIVENEISDASQLRGIVDFFLTENNADRKLSAVQLDRVFTGVARDMIRRNMVNLQYDDTQRRGPQNTSSPGDDDAPETAQPKKPQGTRRASNTKMEEPDRKFDQDYFTELLRDARIDPRDIERMIDAAKFSQGDLEAMLKRMGNVDPELAKTMLAASLLSVKK